MTAEFVPMPVSPRELLQVQRFHSFEEQGRRLLFVVENAAFIELDEAAWRLAEYLHDHERIRRPDAVQALADDFGSEEAESAVVSFEQLGVLVPAGWPGMGHDRISLPAEPLSSLVLHVSHDCNMRCGYCYADYGRYGSEFGYMDPELAVRHVERFFDGLAGRRVVHLTFFGGEPLMNMPVVHAAHAYAKARAEREGRHLSCGLTTNGTLLTPELARFFERERFSITVSIDGPPDVNDRLRTLQDGAHSYAVVMERVRASGIRANARVTITKKCLDVARIVRHLVSAGFMEVGVSPVATGRDRFDLSDADLVVFLEGLEALAEDFVEWARSGRLFPFSNLRTTIEQIAAGDPRPVPCGAGTRLVAADNKGDLYACHRLVGQEEFRVGTVEDGVDGERRHELLKRLHPRTRNPCRTCWARYLCGGGCHHIAWLHSGQREAPWQISDAFCDFLRGWYRLGLVTYARLAEEAPEVLARLGSRAAPTGCNQAQGQ